MKMKRSPIFSKDEIISGGCDELDYDLQEDFAKFLEEARKNAINLSLKSSLPTTSSIGESVAVEGKWSKRSWKNRLSSWLKFKKKSTPPPGLQSTETTNSYSYQNHSAASGQILGSEGMAGLARRIRDTASGPLSGCFTPARAQESEIPYLCLDQQKKPSHVTPFGPIYLVT